MTSGWFPEAPGARQVLVPWRGQEVALACALRAPAVANLPTLLCLHGAYCHRGSFSCVFESEALRDCGILAVDLPGHGDSSKIPYGGGPEVPFPTRLEEMTEAVATLLVQLQVRLATPPEGWRPPPLVLLGHSLGGAVCLLLAERLAQMGQPAQGFISLEGCLVASDTPEKGLANRWRLKDPTKASTLDLLEDIAAAAHLGRDPAGLLHWRDCAERCGPTAHLLAVRMSSSLVAWSRSGALVQRLDSVPLVRYIYGVRSGKYTVELRAALAGRSHCRAVGIPSSGHFMLLDSQEETLQLIAQAVAEAEEVGRAQQTAAALGGSASAAPAPKRACWEGDHEMAL